MNKALGVELLAYSFIVAGLGLLSHALGSASAKPTLLIGLIAGAVCALLAVRVLAGKKGKALPILALAVTSFFLLAQASHLLWPGDEANTATRSAGVVALVMLVLSVAMVMGIAWKGAFPAAHEAGAEPTAQTRKGSSNRAFPHS